MHVDCVVPAPCQEWNPNFFLMHQVTLKMLKKKQDTRSLIVNITLQICGENNIDGSTVRNSGT